MRSTITVFMATIPSILRPSLSTTIFRDVGRAAAAVALPLFRFQYAISFFFFFWLS